MASVGRKFLLAGKGGLNLTHSEPLDSFLSRYGTRRSQLPPVITSFGPDAIRDWVLNLGAKTFIGTSHRIFPVDLKTAPRPLAEAISTAGGVAFEDLDERFMLRSFPEVFCAGEMLDWDTPTGGYLVTACLATGRAAGAGAVMWANRRGGAGAQVGSDR